MKFTAGLGIAIAGIWAGGVGGTALAAPWGLLLVAPFAFLATLLVLIFAAD